MDDGQGQDWRRIMVYLISSSRGSPSEQTRNLALSSKAVRSKSSREWKVAWEQGSIQGGQVEQGRGFLIRRRNGESVSVIRAL